MPIGRAPRVTTDLTGQQTVRTRDVEYPAVASLPVGVPTSPGWSPAMTPRVACAAVRVSPSWSLPGEHEHPVARGARPVSRRRRAPPRPRPPPRHLGPHRHRAHQALAEGRPHRRHQPDGERRRLRGMRPRHREAGQRHRWEAAARPSRVPDRTPQPGVAGVRGLRHDLRAAATRPLVGALPTVPDAPPFRPGAPPTPSRRPPSRGHLPRRPSLRHLPEPRRPIPAAPAPPVAEHRPRDPARRRRRRLTREPPTSRTSGATSPRATACRRGSSGRRHDHRRASPHPARGRHRAPTWRRVPVLAQYCHRT